MMPGIVVLAAGGSSRLGEPKQLLQYRGESLLRNAARTAWSSRASAVAVVLGAHAERCRAELDGLPVEVVTNAAWATGLASSVRAGLSHLLAHWPALPGVAFALCDQPHLRPAHLTRLLTTLARTDALAATAYSDGVGVPAAFGRDYFDELLALEGERGAKAVLTRHSERVVTVAAPELAVDIDTMAAYRELVADEC